MCSHMVLASCVMGQGLTRRTGDGAGGRGGPCAPAQRMYAHHGCNQIQAGELRRKRITRALILFAKKKKMVMAKMAASVALELAARLDKEKQKVCTHMHA